MLRELGIRLVTLAIGFAVMVAVVPGIDKKDWATSSCSPHRSCSS
jgi:hypothetical protein